MAVANFAYGSDSSRESSPKHTSRKISTVMPIPELSGTSVDNVEHIEGLDGDVRDFEQLAVFAPPPQLSPSQTAAVVQGYYNFGTEGRLDLAEDIVSNVRKVHIVNLQPADVGLSGDALSLLKVKIKDERSVGVSFQVNDESDDEEGTVLLEGECLVSVSHSHV